MTTGTIEYSLTERHLLAMSAPAASLARIGWIHSNVQSPSFFRFGVQLTEECRPRGITNTLGKTMIVYHAVDSEVFHADDPVDIDDLTAFLMGEVVSSEFDTLMHASNCLTMLATLWRAFGKLTMLTLDFGKGLFFFTKEARVSDLFTCGERGKGLETYINADLGRYFRQSLRFAFYRKGDIPLASRGTVNGAGLDLALDWTMVDHLEGADLREYHAVIMRDAKTTLRECEAIVAPIALETRKPWLLSMLFVAPEEGFHGKVNTHRYVLQDLGMHAIKGSAFSFQYREGLLLLIERQARTILLIGRFATFEQMIIEPTALFKRLIELVYLFLGWEYPILKHFTHIHIICLNCSVVKRWGLPHPSALKGRSIHPKAFKPGMNGLFHVNRESIVPISER